MNFFNYIIFQRFEGQTIRSRKREAFQCFRIRAARSEITAMFMLISVSLNERFIYFCTVFFRCLHIIELRLEGFMQY